MKNKISRFFTFAIVTATYIAINIPLPAKAYTSVWDCFLKHRNNEYVGRIDIWWGHTPKDAAWACNEWISECGNNGGCFARRI